MKATIRNVIRFNDGDLSEEEFYKCKGLLTVFEKAKAQELEAILKADCEEALNDALSYLCVKYLLNR